MLVMGGELKRREKLSARLGDILSLMYLCSATLKRYESEGRQKADAPLMHWAIWDSMYKAQMAFDGVIANFPVRFIGRMLYRTVFPLGHPYDVPSDKDRPSGRQAPDRAVGFARSADRRNLRAESRASRSRSARSNWRCRRRSTPSRSRPRSVRRKRPACWPTIPDANVRDIAHAAFRSLGVITPSTQCSSGAISCATS
jgi:acyl-CoA dehydrogenase